MNKIYDMSAKMERTHRYTIGAKLIDAGLSQFRWISLANQARSKVKERIKRNCQIRKNYKYGRFITTTK